MSKTYVRCLYVSCELPVSSSPKTGKVYVQRALLLSLLLIGQMLREHVRR